jgi:hypothetical protein
MKKRWISSDEFLLRRKTLLMLLVRSLVFTVFIPLMYAPLHAQSSYRIGFGAEQTKVYRIFRQERKAQHLTLNPTISLERTSGKDRRWSWIGQLTWNRVRIADAELTRSGDGFYGESLKLDVAKLGLGSQIKLLKNTKWYPLVGGQLFVGLPLRTLYESRNPGGSIFNLPAYQAIRGGAEFLRGWQLYIGGVGQWHPQWAIQFGATGGGQYQKWESAQKHKMELLYGYFLGLDMRILYTL